MKESDLNRPSTTSTEGSIFSGLRSRLTLLIAGLVVGAVSLQADEIVVEGGRNYSDVNISSATWEQVEYKLPGVSKAQKVPAERVNQLLFSRESANLGKGRGALQQGNFEGAVQAFKIARSQGDQRQKTNAQFLYGFALARWAQQDTSQLAAAVSALQEYLGEHEPKKDFYVPHARMALASAQRAAGKWSEAESALAPLARGDMGKRWVVDGNLGQAELMLAQEKWSEAREQFSAVASNSDAVAATAAEAWLGYATCQIGQKQWSAAGDTVRNKVLEGRGGGNSLPAGIVARGWLIWGRATEGQAGGDRTKLQWATIRYFRAAVIATVGHGEVFAEALYRAKEASKALGHTDRAEELTQRLQNLVPGSRWNR